MFLISMTIVVVMSLEICLVNSLPGTAYHIVSKPVRKTCTQAHLEAPCVGYWRKQISKRLPDVSTIT